MPNGCGVGGDAFWLVWDEAAGEQVALNGSGRAPLATDADALRGQGLTRLPLRGPLSITVPGAVRSWADAHRRWGRLSWEAVLAPAIEQAEDGFPAWDGLIARGRGASCRGRRPRRGAAASSRPGARTAGRGDSASGSACRRSRGRCGMLADQGFDAYYDGELGERIVRGLAAAGAPFTLADLREHRSTWGRPIATTYRGVRVTSHPPNSAASSRSRSSTSSSGSRRRDGPLRRPRLDGPSVDPPPARGGQARLRRPGRPPHRSRGARHPGGPAALEGRTRRPRGADRRPPRGPRPAPGRARSSAGRSTSRSWTARATR